MLEEITIAGKPASRVVVPSVPPAPIGFRENCGKRLDKTTASTERNSAPAASSPSRWLKLNAEAAAQQRRIEASEAVARFAEARKQQVMPAARLRDFWQKLS